MGYTALRYAIKERHFEIVKLLVEVGNADVNAKNVVCIVRLAPRQDHSYM